jgi:hypothetical protein
VFVTYPGKQSVGFWVGLGEGGGGEVASRRKVRLFASNNV